MRKIILSAFTVALLVSCGVKQSNSITSNSHGSFKVYGNCGMCEKTIEGSLTNIDGVTPADWNKETKQMEVEFDSTAISINGVKSKIAGIGFACRVFQVHCQLV
ncbi:MAG: mercuric ion binding protein [Glaciecola sp.]|jgi:mercuric ion binding protein